VRAFYSELFPLLDSFTLLFKSDADLIIYLYCHYRFVSEFDPPPELKAKSGFTRGKPNHTDSNRGAGRGRGRGQEHIDEGQFVQMKSVFAEGPMQRQDAMKSGICNGCIWLTLRY